MGGGVKQAMRIVAWTAFNVAFVALVAFALFDGATWARNITLFVVWSYTLLSIGNAIALTYIKVANEKDGKEISADLQTSPLPRWLSITFDLSVVALLAAFGWFGSAVAWFVQSLSSRVADRTAKELRDIVAKGTPVAAE
jgi:hypothetical protein